MGLMADYLPMEKLPDIDRGLRGLTMVQPRLREKLFMEIGHSKDDNHYLIEMTEWVNDSARHGSYTYSHNMGIDPVSFVPIVTALSFFFTDARTAFEFKIRWG